MPRIRGALKLDSPDEIKDKINSLSARLLESGSVFDYFEGDDIAQMACIGPAKDKVFREIGVDTKSLVEGTKKWVIDLSISYALSGYRDIDLLTLWAHALTGNDDALFQLLRVYKTYAGARWVHDRVKAACEKGDLKFLEAYGKALATPLKQHGQAKWQLTEYLLRNWDRTSDPLSAMTTLQIFYELRDAGLEKLEKGKTPSDKQLRRLDRYIERLGLKRSNAT